jgi:hypothetical protein
MFLFSSRVGMEIQLLVLRACTTNLWLHGTYQCLVSEDNEIEMCLRKKEKRENNK